jgi:hypothetical protein
MIHNEIRIPACRCGDEVDQESPFVDTPALRGPAISLDDTIFAVIQDVESDIDANQLIEIQRENARTLLEQFEMLVSRRAFAKEEFMTVIRGYAKRRPEAFAREIVISSLFELLSLYVSRTMHDIKSRKISPQQLRVELKVYLWSGLADWISMHSNQWEHDEIFDNCSEVHMILEAANFGLAGAVSKLWVECLDDIVRLFIWRDVQVRKCRANQLVSLLGFAILSVYSFAAGISALLGYW